MINKGIATIFISFLCLNAISQEQLLSGKIQANGEAVEFAYILNKSKNVGTESKTQGLISLPAQLNDTLIFKCLGYKDTVFIVTPQMLQTRQTILNVQKQEYALDEVKVVWFYSYAAFKQAFLNLKVDDKNKTMKFKVDIDPMDMALNKYFYAPGATGFGVSIGGQRPYLTKEQHEQRAIDNHESRYARYNLLTSHDNIHAFTGLKGDSLNSFIIYLRTHYEINPISSDYEIMCSVKMAYEDFLAMNSPSPDSLLVK